MQNSQIKFIIIKIGKINQKNDVVIFSTSSKKSLVSFEQTNAIVENRKQKNITLVDLSVPRNLPNEISHIQGVDLINIDNLKDQINANYKKRKSEIIKAEQLIDSFLGEFEKTLDFYFPEIVNLSKLNFGDFQKTKDLWYTKFNELNQNNKNNT